jgi:hypothetical protein
MRGKARVISKVTLAFPELHSASEALTSEKELRGLLNYYIIMRKFNGLYMEKPEFCCHGDTVTSQLRIRLPEAK